MQELRKGNSSMVRKRKSADLALKLTFNERCVFFCWYCAIFMQGNHRYAFFVAFHPEHHQGKPPPHHMSHLPIVHVMQVAHLI